ncbi:MAG: DUF692 domain-containing protein [Bryobacteraceae bacterium]
MDRFGLSWRGALAAEILANRDRIDCLEVIADDYTGAGARIAGSLRMLARHMPVSLHSIQLGISSLEGVDQKRLDRVARLLDTVQPESWSEHLAFVRGGGLEIGHLAAPPRNSSTVDATLANLDRVRRACGRVPAIENIATLIDPPLSPFTEPQWLARILAGCENPMLLDLHNVYSNATNFGMDPFRFLDELPLCRVTTIHIAGGKWIESKRGARRWLDDHKNPTPGGVYELLEHVAARVPQPLTVILERDGNFPAIDEMLGELDQARKAVARGRANPVQAATALLTPVTRDVAVNAETQARLAKLYLEPNARADFLADSAIALDVDGLYMAAHGFARKRGEKGIAGH